MYIIKKRVHGIDTLTYEKSIVLSKFVPIGLLDLLRSLPEDTYVLGVCYDKDNQICMSGKIKNSETPILAMKREMREELYLSTKKLVFFSKLGRNFFYKVKITDCDLNYKFGTNENEDTPKRVVGCVYGKFSDVENYINTVEIDENNVDNIKGVWAVHRDELLRVLNN